MVDRASILPQYAYRAWHGVAQPVSVSHDEPAPLKCTDHLIDRGRGNQEMPFDVCLRRGNAETMHVLFDEVQVLVLSTRRTRLAVRGATFVAGAGQLEGNAFALATEDEDGTSLEMNGNRVRRRLGHLRHHAPGNLFRQPAKIQSRFDLSHVSAHLSLAYLPLTS